MGIPASRSDLGDKGVTLWRSIADDLEQAIRGGVHASGERLPAEMEIAARFGVNRHTVRRAIAELVSRGLVRSARGSGTYVLQARLDYRIGARTRFSEIMAAAGVEASGRLVDSGREPASAEIAARLGLARGVEVLRLDILRTANRMPISVATSFLPAARFPDFADIFRRQRSITKALGHFGITGYRRKWTRVSAGLADAMDAARLRLPAHRPLLVVESYDVDAQGVPVLTTRGRFAADRVALTIES